MDLLVMYVAGPYRAATKAGIELNIQSAKAVAKLVSKKGWAVICPHTNTAHMDDIDPSIPDSFWLDATMTLLRKSDAIALTPGWEYSSGTLAEIEEAKRLGITVYESPNLVPDVTL